MQVFGDGYISLRYKLGLPIVSEGDAPITLFWFLDALQVMLLGNPPPSPAPLDASQVTPPGPASSLGTSSFSAHRGEHHP